MNLEDKTDNKVSIIVELMQTELVKRRLLRIKGKEALSFSIYRIKTKDGKEKNRIKNGKKFEGKQLEWVAKMTTYLYARQVCRRFNLPAGDYVIIPSCFDKDIDMKFLLRVFMEGAQSDSVKITNLKKQKKKEEVININYLIYK